MEPLSQEEMMLLAHKIKKGTASAEEEVELLRYLNQGMKELRTFIRDTMVDYGSKKEE